MKKKDGLHYLPFRSRSRTHEYHGQWPAKRSFEKRIDDAETYDPDAPDVQYFPIPVRAPDGSWEEGACCMACRLQLSYYDCAEQYEIQRARKDMSMATWRNQGQESFGHVYVRREERR